MTRFLFCLLALGVLVCGLLIVSGSLTESPRSRIGMITGLIIVAASVFLFWKRVL